MNKIKYLLCVILIFIAIVFDYEIYQNYMYAFEDFYTTSFYLPEETTQEEVVKQLTEMATKYQVELFFIENRSEGNFYTEVNLYCNKRVKNYLEEKYWIKEGMHKSIFSGSTKVHYYNFEKLSLEKMEQMPENYYLLGQRENICQYKSTLMEKYGGAEPQKEGRNSRKDACEEYLLLWMGVIVILLFFTLYQEKVLQKEAFIYVSMGTSKGILVLKYALQDIIVYLAIFSLEGCVTEAFMGKRMLLVWEYVSMAGLIVVNTMLYLPLLKLKVKNGMVIEKLSQTVLRTNYILKVCLTLMVSIFLATNVQLILEYLQLNQQSSFYRELKEYYYVVLMPKEEQQQEELETCFYYNYFKKFNILNMQSNVEYTEAGKNKRAVCMNGNTKKYVYRWMPELKGKLDGKESYLILPKNNKLSGEEIEYLKKTCLSLSGRDRGKVSVIEYNQGAQVYTLDVEEKYAERKNPVIIFSNRTVWEHIDKLETWIPELYLNQTFVKASEEELSEFQQRYRCNYQLINVYNDYQFDLMRLKRGAMLNGILSLAFLGMELLVLYGVIHMEFTVNRREIVLKRLYGYSSFQQLRKLYVLTVASCLGTIVWLFTIKEVCGFSHFGISCSLILIFLGIELIIIRVKFLMEEKRNVQRVIKGGYF